MLRARGRSRSPRWLTCRNVPSHLARVSANIGDGDDHRFAVLLRSVEPLLRRQIARFTRDADLADDLYQETCIRLWTKRAHHSGRGPYPAWAMRVCRNTCITAIRKCPGSSVMPSVEVSSFDAERITSEASAIARDAYYDKVANAVAALPARKRAVVIGRWFFAKSAPQIARDLGMQVNSVWTSLSQAKSALRGLLPPPSPADE